MAGQRFHPQRSQMDADRSESTRRKAAPVVRGGLWIQGVGLGAGVTSLLLRDLLGRSGLGGGALLLDRGLGGGEAGDRDTVG